MPSNSLPYSPGAGDGNSPIIPTELIDSDFAKTADGYGVNIDQSGSNVSITRDPATGIAIKAPAPTVSLNALGNELTVSYPGFPDQVLDLSPLDNEGVTLVVDGQNFELRDKDGNVLSSTPITQLDAQQLSASATATAWTVSLTNGGSAALSCADIGALYEPAPGPVPPGTQFLGDQCVKYTRDNINTTYKIGAPSGLLTEGVSWDVYDSDGGTQILSVPPLECSEISALYPEAAAQPDLSDRLLGANCQSYTIKSVLAQSSNSLSIVNGVVTSTVNGVSTTANLPSPAPTTNALTIAGGVVTSTVNGVAATANLPATTVSNAIAGNQLSTTVNGVTSAPVTLPSTAANLVWGSGVHGVVDQTTGTVAIVPIYQGNSNAALVPPAPSAPLVGKFLQADGTWAAPPAPPPATPVYAGTPLPGLVPAVPPAPLVGKFLQADGSWATPVIPVYAGTPAPGLVPSVPPAPLVGKFLQADGTWASPTTTHVNAWTKSLGLQQSVNGVASNTSIPAGTIVDMVGYDSTGSVVWERSTKTYMTFIDLTANVPFTINHQLDFYSPDRYVIRATVGNQNVDLRHRGSTNNAVIVTSNVTITGVRIVIEG